MGVELKQFSDHINFETIPIERLIQPPEWKRITSEEPANTKFNVIIPAKNEEVVIGGLLRNIIRQSIPRNSSLYVDVVLNDTTDHTKERVEEMQYELGQYQEKGDMLTIEIRNLNSDQPGKIAAINYGIQHARSDIVISIDADVFPTSNSIAKLYALLRTYPSCVAASIMPKRKDGSSNIGTLQGMQEYYDAITRENGAIFGRLFGFKQNKFSPFPENILSNDTWLEFTAIATYGFESVKFLGLTKDSDVFAYYHGPKTYVEYVNQLLRWESGFQYLMKTYPELWVACNIADRVKQPKGIVNAVTQLQTAYPEISFKDKLLMFYLLKVIRSVTRLKPVYEKFGSKPSWTSPRSDRSTY